MYCPPVCPSLSPNLLLSTYYYLYIKLEYGANYGHEYHFLAYDISTLLLVLIFCVLLREDIKKKTADLVKIALLGGRGSEKLLNFHHLQMMKNMEGGGVSE